MMVSMHVESSLEILVSVSKKKVFLFISRTKGSKIVLFLAYCARRLHCQLYCCTIIMPSKFVMVRLSTLEHFDDYFH